MTHPFASIPQPSFQQTSRILLFFAYAGYFFAKDLLWLYQLARDLKEFLKLLNSNSAEYLLIGGYAVGIYGHIRATHDLDIWVNISPDNATRIDRALREFGFSGRGDLGPFLARNNMVRMGAPPIRIEILTSISGVEFDACYTEKQMIRVE